jgi:hypothetical protein
MLLTQEQIQEAVSGAIPDILTGLRNEIAESAIFQARQTAYSAVQKAVTDWVNENLVPEILQTLAASKEGLIASAPQLANCITSSLVEAFSESVKKKLESSWERKKIFEAFFG